MAKENMTHIWSESLGAMVLKSFWYEGDMWYWSDDDCVYWNDAEEYLENVPTTARW